MTIEGVDYSYSPPSATGLAAGGKRFACRYVGPGNRAKMLDGDELRTLRAAGIDVVANAEGSANGYRGTTAGRDWATLAEHDCRLLGMPVGRPIYFSVDWDAGSSDWAAIDAALRGSAAVLGADRVGVYGGYDTIAHCASAGTASWFWQTYAWSGGKWHPACHLQQYKNNVALAGGTVDLTRAVKTDYGQWGAKVATSQNGWTVDTTGSLQDRGDLVPGVSAPNGIRKGDVATVLRHVARRFHAEVEPLRAGWCWGWFVKVIEGGTATSNHASGTAVDLNAPDHPVGAVDTFSAAKRTAIHKILTDLGGVVRWGGDYSGRHDDMHFEINAGAAAVKALADKIRGTQQEDIVTPEDFAKIRAIVAEFFTLGKQSDGTPWSPVGAAVLSQGIPNPIAGGKRTTAYTTLADIASTLAATGKKVDVNAATLSSADHKIDAVTAALAQIGSGGVDERALAEAIVNALPAEAADRFVDALIERVRRGTGPT